MFDHRISIEDKLRDFCLLSLSLSCSQSPLLPQFAKYKTEMTTISQHYVARGALLTAQLEIITREERRFTIRREEEIRSQDTGTLPSTVSLLLITALLCSAYYQCFLLQ